MNEKWLNRPSKFKGVAIACNHPGFAVKVIVRKFKRVMTQTPTCLLCSHKWKKAIYQNHEFSLKVLRKC